ncbi:sugar phosphate isomerase/epimerase family protein [Flexivirga meconopsidis]|uniref:sugar phosphate isomerase/epimerase family protein n=1 Tax=Flexivirga meconopsidis TaxID=2977121 RepID=UPI00223FE241|nr:sugar phosphate isomerase/epimerase family protein [Flexivirga meconopsidis]
MSTRLCGIGDEAARALPDQLDILDSCGMTAIELRTVDGRLLHELHREHLEDLVRTVRERGFEVPVIDTPIGGWSTSVMTDERAELALLAQYAEIARRFGARLRIMSYPNDGLSEHEWATQAIRRVRRLVIEADALGVTLLHENCAGFGGAGPDQACRLLEGVGDGLDVIFDVGNGLAYGYDAVAYLDAVLPAVRHVHVKDGVRRTDGAVFLPPGHGSARLAECLEILRRRGFDGWYSLEPHVSHIPHLHQTGSPTELTQGFVSCAGNFRHILEDSHVAA